MYPLSPTGSSTTPSSASDISGTVTDPQGMVQQEYDDSDDSEDDVDGMTRTPAQPAQAQQQQPRASMGSTSFNGMAADSATFGAPMQQQQAVQGQVQGEGKKKKAAGGDDGEKKVSPHWYFARLQGAPECGNSRLAVSLKGQCRLAGDLQSDHQR